MLEYETFLSTKANLSVISIEIGFNDSNIARKNLISRWRSNFALLWLHHTPWPSGSKYSNMSVQHSILSIISQFRAASRGPWILTHLAYILISKVISLLHGRVLSICIFKNWKIALPHQIMYSKRTNNFM